MTHAEVEASLVRWKALIWRMVMRYARRYPRRQRDQAAEELYHEARVGWCLAARDFDPAVSQYQTYALQNARWAVLKHLHRCGRTRKQCPRVVSLSAGRELAVCQEVMATRGDQARRDERCARDARARKVGKLELVPAGAEVRTGTRVEIPPKVYRRVPPPVVVIPHFDPEFWRRVDEELGGVSALAVRLVFAEGLTYPEVGARLGLGAARVRARVGRALRRLRGRPWVRELALAEGV